MKFWLANDDETRAAGAALAADLLELAHTMPVVVFVRGNLGAGKSTFVRGFLSHAGVSGVMPSPTYTLVEPYTVDSLNLFHMDAYRIADGAELDYLGLDTIDQPGTIVLIEWPDHVQNELPAPTVTVTLEISVRPVGHGKLDSGQGTSAQDSQPGTPDVGRLLRLAGTVPAREPVPGDETVQGTESDAAPVPSESARAPEPGAVSVRPEPESMAPGSAREVLGTSDGWRCLIQVLT